MTFAHTYFCSHLQRKDRNYFFHGVCKYIFWVLFYNFDHSRSNQKYISNSFCDWRAGQPIKLFIHFRIRFCDWSFNDRDKRTSTINKRDWSVKKFSCSLHTVIYDAHPWTSEGSYSRGENGQQMFSLALENGLRRVDCRPSRDFVNQYLKNYLQKNFAKIIILQRLCGIRRGGGGVRIQTPVPALACYACDRSEINSKFYT